jgi:hypothetical protein
MGKLLFFLENTGEMCFFAKRRRERRKGLRTLQTHTNTKSG